MADAIVRLKLESQEYDGKLKRAVDQMSRMEQEVRRTGATFAYADKEKLEFVRSLGQMSTKATSSMQKLREYSNAIMSLTETYRAMTTEEKNSEFGKAMAASIDELKAKAANLKDIMADTQAEIKRLASDTGVFDQVAGGITAVTSAFQVGQGAMQVFGVKNKDAMQAMAQLQGVMAVTNGLSKIQAALQKESAVMIGIATVQKKAAAAAEAIDTAAKEKNIAVTKGAAIAQKALNAVANANPFLLLASAIGAVVAALSIFSRSASKAADDQKKFAQSVGSSMGEMVSSYTLLKNQWEQLTTEQEKNDWIKNNESEFSKLGIAINDVADAEKVFKDETAAMVKSFELRAKAAALQSLAEENYKKYYENAAGKELSEGQEITDMQAAKMHVLGGKEAYKEENGKFTLTKEGAALYNKTMFGDGKEKADAFAQSIQDVKKELDDLYKNNGLKTAEGTNPIEVKVEPVIPEGSAAALKKQLSDLQKQWDMATSDEDRSGIQKQIDETQKALDKMNGKVENTAKVVEKASKPVEGSIAAQREAVNELQKAWENAADDESRAKIKEQLDAATESLNKMLGKTKEVQENPIELTPDMNGPDMSAFEKLQQSIRIKLADQNFDVDQNSLMNMMTVAIQNGITGMDGAFEGLQYQLAEGINIPDEAWQALADQINEQLANLGLDPIELDVKTGNIETAAENLKSQAKGVGEGWNAVASAVNTVGGALQQIEDPGAKIAGIIAQAVANVALSFAEAAASPAVTSTGWGWLGFAAAGIATMISTIASIKSVTAGSYASGGIVPGNSYSGDNLTANVNSGELILNRAQQDSVASQLQGNNPFGNLALSMELKGEDIQICLDNNRMRRGR